MALIKLVVVLGPAASMGLIMAAAWGVEVGLISCAAMGLITAKAIAE